MRKRRLRNLQMDFKETLAKCEEFGFNEQITREMLWNSAYQLGRSRWYWGPAKWRKLVRQNATTVDFLRPAMSPKS